MAESAFGLRTMQATNGRSLGPRHRLPLEKQVSAACIPHGANHDVVLFYEWHRKNGEGYKRG